MNENKNWAHIRTQDWILLICLLFLMCIYTNFIQTCNWSPAFSLSSGTMYRAGTVCLVENGPYVARIDTGWLACATVNRLNDNTESWFSLVADGAFFRSVNVLIDWAVECLKKNPLSGFSKLTCTELAKSVFLKRNPMKWKRKQSILLI